jgi:formate-dependent nitrite reductase membrane component NrfD
LDLERPERFYFLLTRPQWGSWLARGAVIITIAAGLAAAFGAAVVTHSDALRDVLSWAMIPSGAALAGYTALLFNQCEGRDLWQSRLLLPHTLVNALLAGAGALGIATAVTAAPAGVDHLLGWLIITLAAAGAPLIAFDLFGTHGSGQAERAAHNLTRGRFAREFWLGGVVTGMLLASALAAAALVVGSTPLLAAAGGAALAGLWLYEDAWVRAGQSTPLS